MARPGTGYKLDRMDEETRAAFGRIERSFQLAQQEMRAGFERVERIERTQHEGLERFERIERAQHEGFERFERIERALQEGFERVDRIELAQQKGFERIDHYFELAQEQHLQLVARTHEVSAHLADLSERVRTLEAEFRSFRDWATTQFSDIFRQLRDIVNRLDRLEHQRNGSMG
jgi:hypothetical protein